MPTPPRGAGALVLAIVLAASAGGALTLRQAEAAACPEPPGSVSSEALRALVQALKEQVSAAGSGSSDSEALVAQLESVLDAREGALRDGTCDVSAFDEQVSALSTQLQQVLARSAPTAESTAGSTDSSSTGGSVTSQTAGGDASSGSAEPAGASSGSTDATGTASSAATPATTGGDASSGDALGKFAQLLTQLFGSLGSGHEGGQSSDSGAASLTGPSTSAPPTDDGGGATASQPPATDPAPSPAPTGPPAAVPPPANQPSPSPPPSAGGSGPPAPPPAVSTPPVVPLRPPIVPLRPPVVAARPAALQGLVRAGSGPGISGALVTVAGRHTTTNGQGLFTVSDVPPGRQTVVVSAAGFRAGITTVNLSSGEAGRVTLTLQHVTTPGGSVVPGTRPSLPTPAVPGPIVGLPPGGGRPAIIQGQVRADSGATIANALITVGGHRATTNAQGVFVVGNVPPGRQVLVVTATGFRAGSLTVNLPSGGSERLTLTLHHLAPRPIAPAEAPRPARPPGQLQLRHPVQSP